MYVYQKSSFQCCAMCIILSVCLLGYAAEHAISRKESGKRLTESGLIRVSFVILNTKLIFIVIKRDYLGHEICRFTSSCTYAKYHPGLCSTAIHLVVSNDSVSGQ